MSNPATSEMTVLPAAVAGSRLFPASQQPDWQLHPSYHSACAQLSSSAPLVTLAELHMLGTALSTVATGQALVIQAGDCAENLQECTEKHVGTKVQVLDELAGLLTGYSGRDVVRIGRIGGQFAKPRSQTTEWYGGRKLPTFRGHLINSELPTPHARRPDPRRMVWAYQASAAVAGHLAAIRAASPAPSLGPWSSHEALVLDYEENLVRAQFESGVDFLGSTHLPWVGERTRQPGSAHVRLLASVANPVACKVGPLAKPEDVVRVCELLDVDRVPGRLVLIARMGRGHVTNALGPIVSAVHNRGHQPVWLSDPMHGNTVRTPEGWKTRYLKDIVAEAVAARDILRALGQHAAGLHLEVAADEVTECVGGPVPDTASLRARYTTLCDPRLNPRQAELVVQAWAQER
ncbi:3-deoxy-7-phosphoheptulonate synthase [Kibdelosporangium aridum]|nr:3-deoxy-7-phosphoheptulonate synthase [Kibdelosporangium aridum]